MAKNKNKKKPKQDSAGAADEQVASGDWHVVAYQAIDKATKKRTTPAFEWLAEDGPVPREVRLELFATIVAVSQRDPQKFRAYGDRWQFMRKPRAKGEVDMSGIAEARDKHDKVLYRLFCVIDSQGADHGLPGPSIVLVDGDSKPVREAMPQSVYKRIDGYRNDYHEGHRVAGSASYPDWWPGETEKKG